ncbi:FAD-dependent oxidoreductase [Rosistilla oblonga]|uniref:FAD-dependent oxidoreductase n=1 Tax=Rosistilla oblonga TaxID=2527990 RepID=UPI003A970412
MRIAALLLLTTFPVFASAAELFVEAESFQNHGGWKLDTQFIQEMGSPYLLAHGIGTPVDDATAEVTVAEAGTYHVFVRTKDWVARWNAPGTPGRFQLAIDGKKLATEFGTQGAEWAWQSGGTVDLPAGKTELRLIDQTGFDGRCDAIYLTTDKSNSPPNESKVLSKWRREQLGIGDEPVERIGYDLVVVGGGYSGLGAAISGARMGCKVALIQDRGVLGGNGSSEVRVWAMGNIRRGRYPRIGEIIEEISDNATKSPGKKEEFVDELKEQVVRAEENIDLFLNHRAFAVETEGDRIVSVDAFDTRNGAVSRFKGMLFADCTGHAWIGAWAGADLEMTPDGRMGMSNMWAWDEQAEPAEFPETPWALPLKMADFPYPRDHHGQWFWESGFDKDPLGDAEGIRDWNLRAVYGAFNAMKNGDGAEKHRTAFLTWVAYIGGPRESRRLIGDVLLNEEDIVSKRDFPDGTVPSTWSIDLHYPKKQYAAKFPDNPFISIAVHGKGVDRMYGYPIPYRCFYSRNISNLFMAGRCASVTHEALGTVRVMKTCGMMGEVVGKAAAICVERQCLPRGVYTDYLDQLTEMLELPGKAYRKQVGGETIIPDDALPLAGPAGLFEGLDPAKMKGLVIDDEKAKVAGPWVKGQGLKGYVAYGYRYASPGSGATMTFEAAAPEAGSYDIRVLYGPHPNRGTTVPVSLEAGGETISRRVDMRGEPTAEAKFATFADVQLKKGAKVLVTIGSDGAGGNVHADAIQLIAK